MNNLLISSPHTHGGLSVSKVMWTVMLALVPATLFSFYVFGFPAIFLFLVTCGSAVGFEALALKWSQKPVQFHIHDGSALLTGWLVAMTLPPYAPWWIGVVGGLIAIMLGKQVYGGLGQNLFNPAMVARIALLISFPVEMTTWVSPHPLFEMGSPSFFESLQITFLGTTFADGSTSATTLGYIKTELSRGISLQDSLPKTFTVNDLFWGKVSGSMGETSAFLLLLGGIALIFMGIITWHIPVAILVTLAVCAGVANGINPLKYPPFTYHLFAGAAMLGAFFIATDPVTSPVSKMGQIVFGVGCGVLIFVIRSWAGYPEGVGFAVLLMNAMTPLLDRWLRPRVYGRSRKGDPLQYSNDAEK
jgi:Na+-translocating ferredoxin:NAD+ oxidoreductase subunit D